MGKQSASRREGDTFQDLYCCYELLQLLFEDPPFEYAWLEHEDAGSADDLTLHALQGSDHPSRFIQLKWHVNQGHLYSIDSLMAAQSGQKKSLLQKLFDSWVKIREKEPAEVWLVSNRQGDQRLRGFIRSRAYTLEDDFFNSDDFAAWRDSLGASSKEAEEFCRNLRLRFGFDSIEELGDRITDRMRGASLRAGRDARAVLCEEIRSRIEIGGRAKRIDREELLAIVRKLNLGGVSVEEARVRKNKPEVSLWVHGWAFRAYEETPTLELDWTPYFDWDERRIPDQELWDEKLFPKLKEAKRALSRMQGGSFIDFRAKLALSATLAVGHVFSDGAGCSFRTEQPVCGETFLWASKAPPTQRQFVEDAKNREEYGGDGRDVLIIFSVTGDAFATTLQLQERLRPTLAAVRHYWPDGGPGGTSIRSAGDATALAQAAKELLKNTRNLLPDSRTHLVVYAPAAFCLFLGQKLNALGDILTYEMKAGGKDYQPSVLLRTN